MKRFNQREIQLNNILESDSLVYVLEIYQNDLQTDTKVECLL